MTMRAMTFTVTIYILLFLPLAFSLDDACRDRLTSCKNYKNQCFGDNSRMTSFLKTYCERTCGYCGATQTTQPPTEKFIPPKHCGRSSVSSGRIIGGEVAAVGRWPWIARLYKADSSKSFCGGALINPSWIVTASHCLQGETDETIDIHLGRHSIDDSAKIDTHIQIIKVKRIILHHAFNSPSRMNNDIALIELKTPAKINSRVKPICLPRKNYSPPVGSKCFLAGWGKTSHPGKPSMLLRQTNLNIVDNFVCKRLNNRYYRIPVTKQMLCAGLGPEKIQGACHGDSGGPLMCEENQQFFLHGAVSWGPSDCQSRKAYSVFAQINLYRDWIDSFIK